MLGVVNKLLLTSSKVGNSFFGGKAWYFEAAVTSQNNFYSPLSDNYSHCDLTPFVFVGCDAQLSATLCYPRTEES